MDGLSGETEDVLRILLSGQEFKERPVSEGVFFLSGYSPLPSRKGKM